MEQTYNIHREIIEKCKEGDQKSFFELYRLYSKSMLNTSCRILNNTEDAEDALQESFIAAFHSLHQYQYRSAFGAWLKKIVVNHSLNALKRKRKKTLIELDDSTLNKSEPDNEEFNFKIEQVLGAMKKLPEGYRIIFSLYLLEGYEHKEIGEMLGVSTSTSLTQYHRAKLKLRELLKQ